MISRTTEEQDSMSTDSGDSSYLFSLRGRRNLFIKDTISINFTPVRALNFQENKQELGSYSITPKFNQDQKYYSQAFSSDYEGMDPDKVLKSQYKSRVKQQITQIQLSRIVTKINTQLIPKPRNCGMCYVCRIYIEDYLEHIESRFHRDTLRSSKVNTYIADLISQVQSSTIPEEYPLRKSKRILKMSDKRAHLSRVCKA